MTQRDADGEPPLAAGRPQIRHPLPNSRCLGHRSKAVEMFDLMRAEGLRPDQFMFGYVPYAFARLTTLEHGRRVPGVTAKTGRRRLRQQPARQNVPQIQQRARMARGRANEKCHHVDGCNLLPWPARAGARGAVIVSPDDARCSRDFGRTT